MSSIKMVALRKHPFGTGEREAGEEYEATADESAILIALGWAKKAAPKVEKPAAAPSAPAPQAQPPAKVEKVVKPAKEEAAPPDASKRTYQRRDLKAKD
ncbi:putative membrane protein [Variovorax boronicumulans]|uniref:hypothetical protein n=1 Tax=Variovorax boronicumulans TaxID=436515 RepID=UPI002785B42D|nr:hypothetical protein [Variovorax boronicumulans]MDQ0035923.1 putative membrane protein [Variovorax boronicumulans]